MQIIEEFITTNCDLLFRHSQEDHLVAIFDSKGFVFTQEAQTNYNKIKSQPHMYVAWSENGYYYIGKSFQNGGRWKRQHAYHLGTLAHHLLNTIRYDDQNHNHWIDAWMERSSFKKINDSFFSIRLKSPVYISFIPFNIYDNRDFNALGKTEVKEINKAFEKKLIEFFQKSKAKLLNVQLAK